MKKTAKTKSPLSQFDNKMDMIKRRILFLCNRVKTNKKREIAVVLDKKEIYALKTALACMEMVRGYFSASMSLIEDLADYTIIQDDDQ